MKTPRMSRKTFLKITGAATGSLALSSCAPAATSEPTVAPTATPVPAPTATPQPVGPKAGGVLRYAEVGEFNHLSPWRMSAVNMAMYNQVFDRLIWKDDSGKERAGMAESWQMAPDGLSFTVKLRQNTKWHDGTDFVADDVVNMYNYTKDAELQKDAAVAKMVALMEVVSDVKAVDKYTVQFVFPKPVPYITDILDYMWAVRIDDKADPSFTKTLPVGTGPFKIVEWVPNQYTKYVRNAEYYDQGLPYLDEWLFQRLSKAETLIPNLESGTLDGIYGPPPADVARLQNDPRFVAEISDAQGVVFHLLVNTKLPPFDKKEVRQALSYSIDRQTIVKNACFGTSQPVQSIFWFPGSMAYREDLANRYPFDLDKAAKLLESAGVKNLETEVHPTPAWPEMKLFCLIWQADLAKIGVKLNVQEVENARFYEIAGDKDLLGFGLHPYLTGRTTRDPAIFLGTQWPYRSGAANKLGWKNDELEKLVDAAAIETDAAKRSESYQRCNEILTEELPSIQVATSPRIFVWNKSVKDVHYDLSAIPRLDKAWLDK